MPNLDAATLPTNEATPSAADLFAAAFDEAPAPPPEQKAEPAADGAAGEAGDPDAIAPASPADNTPPPAGDPLAELPEPLRQHWQQQQTELQALKDRLAKRDSEFNALHGRLAPLQQRLADYERRLNQPPPASAAPGSGVPAATPGGSPPASPDSIFDSDKWKRYAADYPEEAETLREILTGISRQADEKVRAMQELVEGRLVPTVESLAERNARLAFEEAQRQLSAVHPDWQEINQQPEFAAWLDDWRAHQPAATRPVYYDETRWRRMLSDPQFAADLLHQYKRDLYLATLHATGDLSTAPADSAPAAPAAAASPPATPASRQPAALALAAAPAVRHASPVRRSGMDGLSPGDLMAHYFPESQT